MEKVSKMRHNEQTADYFRKAYNGQKNFMSPHIIGYYKSDVNSMIIEISWGSGFNKRVYGVTVLDRDDLDKRFYDLSKPFDTKAEAMVYAEKLLKSGFEEDV